MPSLALMGASGSGGKITAGIPTLSYAGSGTSNNGNFTITNFNVNFSYTPTSGSIAGNTFTVTSAGTSGTLVAKTAKVPTNSSTVTASRLAAAQGRYWTQTAPYACHGCASPGHQAPCCAPGPCGCGTFHASGFAYSGFWACCDQGYWTYYWVNYGSSGWTWGGSDYTNGQGEWWKIT